MITHSNIPTNPLTVEDIEANSLAWLQRLLPSEFEVDATLTDVVLGFNNSDLFGETKTLRSSYSEGFLNLYEETDNCSFAVSDADGSRYKVYTEFCFDYTSLYNPYFFSMTLEATLPRNAEGVSEHISLELYIQPRQDVVESMEGLAESLPSLFDTLEADEEELEYASWGRKAGLDAFEHNTLYAGELSRILSYPLSKLQEYYLIMPGSFAISLTKPNSRKLTPVLRIRNGADVYDKPKFAVSHHQDAGVSKYTCS